MILSSNFKKIKLSNSQNFDNTEIFKKTLKKNKD